MGVMALGRGFPGAAQPLRPAPKNGPCEEKLFETLLKALKIKK